MWNTRVGMDDEKGVFVGFTGRASGEPATRRDATRLARARARAPLGTRENFDGDDDDGDGDDDGGDAGESGGEGGG